VGYRLAGSLAVRADALERLSDLAHRLSDQGPFLPTEALRQTIQCDMAALPAVIAALGFRSVEEDGELRFHARSKKKQRRARNRRGERQPPAQPGNSPFAALGDLKFRR
jgi:ATP-dependent RNA helicase SUPV3L1/SUV3